MKKTFTSFMLIMSLIWSLFSTVAPVKADDAFELPDADSDGISNTIETSGWYNLAGGPFITASGDADSDNDGLTDGEEKLFNTNPVDDTNPGIAVKYDSSFKTIQYFAVSNPEYISTIQGGDRYLMTEAMVVRRGSSLHITGPRQATLTVAGSGLTTLTPVEDPADGGWNVAIPATAKAGTYTATVTLGTWTKSMPVYVIFELPTDMPAAQVEAFAYDDNPADLNDEVAVLFRISEWGYYGNWQSTQQPCPESDPTAPCSLWKYKADKGFAQAFFTEQFKKKVLVDHTIQAISGKANQTDAAKAIATWTDREFRINYARVQYTWTASMDRWNDGTGITMSGGGCETTAGVFTTVLRSAGIAARPFAIDYNKTAGHDEGGQIGTAYEYDHSVMLWLDGRWKAQRNYNGGEGLYYPWASGTTGISNFETWPSYTGYASDRNGDLMVSAGETWDFQNGSEGGGTVNTLWPIPADEWRGRNEDWEWDSKYPLTIQQSPDINIYNCQLWKGDNWAPSEWRDPVVSSPTGRNAKLTYILPAAIPSAEAPLENWPYNPKPTTCSLATTTEECNAFKATWSTVCQALPAPSASVGSPLENPSLTDANAPDTVSFTFGDEPVISTPIVINEMPEKTATLLKILSSKGVDKDGDGLFDALSVNVRVNVKTAGIYKFGGWLKVGDQDIRTDGIRKQLKRGTQTVQIEFDGQQIGDSRKDGRYKVTALWIGGANQQILHQVIPSQMVDYKKFTYTTRKFLASEFTVQPASFAGTYTHSGMDENGNGLYESIVIDIPLNIALEGTYQVAGDLYDANGEYVGHATWEGSDATARLGFDVKQFTAPFKLSELTLSKSNGMLVDSRYAEAYQVEDLDGMVEGSTISIQKTATSPGISGIYGVSPDSTFTVTPVDTNANGTYDRLDIGVGVNVTDHGGDYRIEGLLVDGHGTPIAWSTSDPQTLSVGSGQMTLSFDGKMISDRLPLDSDTHALKLVALKIFSGNLSSATLEASLATATTTPGYSRSQFEPATLAHNLFQDDLESGTSKWTVPASNWSLTSSAFTSWSHAWKAAATSAGNESIVMASPVDLTNYASPVLRFKTAYKFTGANDKGYLEVSVDGGSAWTNLKTYTGTSPHWTTEFIDLSAYGEQPNILLRFRANSQTNLLWYLDDVYLNAWPAVTSASYTYSPSTVEVGVNTTFTASYTSIDSTQPMRYSWDFNGEVVETTTPSVDHQFLSSGNHTVNLTVWNLHDNAFTSQVINVLPTSTEYSLTVNTTPAGGGTVTKNPNKDYYTPGEVVELTPNAAPGYQFTGWSGDCTGSGACSVTMDYHKSVTAEFALVDYTLTLNPGAHGTITKNPDNATYHYGDVVTLTAVPDDTWYFGGWGGSASGYTNPVQVTVDGNETVSAVFTQDLYTLTTTPDGSGSIARSPEQVSYVTGQPVELTAVAQPGWTFAGWTGACTGTGTCLVTMDANKSVGATFTQNDYTITINVTGTGVVNRNNSGPYHYGDVVELTAVPGTGWSFNAWSGDLTGNTNPASVTVQGNMTISAAFALTEYTITTHVDGEGAITPDHSGPYHYGDVVSLAAEPNSGWAFANWTGDLSGTVSPLSITIDGNKDVTAHFTELTYTLTINIVGDGTVSTNQPPPYHFHDMVQMTANPAPGWSFVGWTGDRVGTSNPISISITSDKNVTATFSQDQYTLTTSVVGQGSVTKNPDLASYTYGQQVTLTPVPVAGWNFAGWSGACSGTGECVVTIDGNKSVEATFTEAQYGLTVNTIGVGSVNVDPAGPYEYNDVVTLTAVYDPSWTFIGWSGDLTGTENPKTITMDANKSVTATFNIAPVAVNDSYTTAEDTELIVPAAGVLTNDSDADSNTLSAVLVSSPTHGSLVLNSDGSFTYLPEANWSGDDAFTYKANDGLFDSSVVTASISVTAVNDAPVATADVYSTSTNTTLTVDAEHGVLSNDTDVEGTALAAVKITDPAHGSLILNADGSFSYIPAAGWTGTDTFTYKAGDGSAQSAETTVSITVDAPVAANDSYSTAEDIELNVPAPGVLSNDTDPQSDSLTAVKVSDPLHGTLTLNADGSFVYTPNSNWNGEDSFTYKATDGTTQSNVVTVTITVTGTNDAPLATADTYSTAEDTPLVVVNGSGLLANDSDLDGDPLTAVKVTDPQHGTLALNANGSFTYTPESNWNGGDSFTYQANDGSAQSGAVTVSITVTPANDAPVAAADTYDAVEETTLSVNTANGVLINDSDPDGNTLTAVKLTNPTHGTLTFNADGSFTYTAVNNWSGTDSFTYKADDGLLQSSPVTVTIHVAGVNDAPVAIDNEYETAEDTTLTVPAAGVLANDTDLDGNTLTAIKASDPLHGTLTLNPNGSFAYVPDANWYGTVTFTYKANDGTVDSNEATVTITVNGVNDAPAAVADSYNAVEDTTLTVSAAEGVLVNDSDIDSGMLTAVKVSDPLHGTLTFQADGSFTYVPVTNWSGPDTFTYKASDGSAQSAIATVTITTGGANDAPVANADTYSTNEDTALVIPAAGVLTNDSDLDGNTLTAVHVTDPGHGTLTLNSNGSFTYTPASNWNGTDTFTYKANDGTVDSLEAATVSITVNPTNDAPSAAADSYSVAEDSTLTVTTANGVLNNDSDIDSVTLSAVKITDPAHGTLTFNANGSFTYTPAANWFGTDTFTYKASDGTAQSNTATVSITVTGTNDAPVANNDTYNTSEDLALTIPAAGVLTNDTDLDGNGLTAQKVTDPAHGTLTLNADGSFTYTPESNWSGTDSFTYKASDGIALSNTATVTINVGMENDAPTAVNDTYSVDEDAVLNVAATGVLTNDTDPEGNSLTAVKVTDPAHGVLTLNADGSLVYTPEANWNGTDTFTYAASDGSSQSVPATVTITVNPANDAPAALDDSYGSSQDLVLTVPAAEGVLSNDSDLEGDALTASKVTDPSNGTVTLNADGSFTYTPTAGWTGTDSFTYKASDGTAESAAATVTITVGAVNHVPVAAADAYSTNEDQALTVAAADGLLKNDTDSDLDTLSAVKVSDPAHGVLVLSADGSFTYTPAANWSGSDSFTYKASDGTAQSGTVSVTLTVNPVNDAPTAANDAYSTHEDATLNVSAANGVLKNDLDIEGAALTAVKVSGPAHGVLVLNTDGSFTYTPTANWSGTDSFTYKAGDGSAQSGVATVTITVNAVNDAPVAANDGGYVTDQGVALNIAAPGVLINDMDQEGDALQAQVVVTAAHGTLTLNANGSFTYTPEADFVGQDTFTYKAFDGTSLSNEATVTITVVGIPVTGGYKVYIPLVDPN